MTKEKSYLIYLLSCFLNGEMPKARAVDWNTVYNLADINDVGAVVASVVNQLPKEKQPQGRAGSHFRQLIGQSIQHDAQRTTAYETVKDFLSENNVDFLPVKGIDVKDLYTSPELRTSGDIDIIVRESSFDKVCKLSGESEVQENFGITDFYIKAKTAYLRISGFLVEIHSNPDVANDYFGDIFDVAEKADKYEYRLKPYDSLMYVFLHLVKHIACDKGAGIRMFIDIDVIIRSIPDFDENSFYAMCNKAGELKHARIILSVISKAFNTPVKDTIGINSNPQFYDEMLDVVLDGGSFGYLVQSKGFYHYYRYVNPDESVTKGKRLLAMVRYVFPSPEYVRNYRSYSQKHALLIPLAYIARAKDALIKRKTLAFSTFREIATVKDKDIQQRKFLEKINNKDDIQE